jgi:ribosomal protein S18 acetylase RimI-like enzyme
MYLLSVAIHPEYQGRGLSEHFIRGFYRFIINKRKENILFSSALSSSVGTPGRRMLEKLGAKEVKRLSEGSTLHELIIDDVYYKRAEAYVNEL